MQQAVMTAPGKIEFKEIEKPVAGPDEVLLEMKHIGVCGSDVHVFHGRHPFTSYPVTQGHECSAVIESIGGNVTGLKAGQTVTFTPQVVCGKCPPCRRGDYHICDHLKVCGFQTDGAACTFFKIPAWNIVPLPEGVSLAQGAFIEPLAVGVHAAGRLDNVRGKNVVVIGAGPIGNCCAQSVKAAGGNVVITDIDAFKLQKAEECGLEQTINVVKQDFAAGAKAYLGNADVDALMECAGTTDTLNLAVNCVRKGGEVLVVAVFGMGIPVDVGIIQDRELDLKGSLMYRKEDFEQAVAYIAEGKCLVDPLITQHFPFADYPAAYDLINEKQQDFVKVMIDL